MAPQSFDGNKTFVARLLPAQWFGIIVTLVTVGAVTWGGLLDIRKGIAEADAKGEAANSRILRAEAANEILRREFQLQQQDIQIQLKSLSNQVSRMEGSLDAIKDLVKNKP